MADHYQLEDGSGNYQLEDGSGSYLLEIQESDTTILREDGLAISISKKKRGYFKENLIPNLLTSTLSAIVPTIVLRNPTFQFIPKIKRKIILDEIFNLLITTLSIESGAYPFVQRELSGLVTKKRVIRQEEIPNLLLTTLAPPPTQQDIDKILGKVYRRKSEETVNLLTSTLTISVVALPVIQLELDKFKFKIRKIANEPELNLLTSTLSSAISIILRNPTIQPLLTRKKVKLLSEEFYNLALLTATPSVNPQVQQELYIVPKARKKISIMELPNLLTSTLGPIIMARFHRLPSVLTRKKVKFTDEIPNLLVSTLSTPVVGLPIVQQEFRIASKIKRVKQFVFDIPNLLTTTLAPIIGIGFNPTCKLVLHLTRSDVQIIQVTRTVNYTKEMVTS